MQRRNPLNITLAATISALITASGMAEAKAPVIERAAVRPGRIEHIMVIDLENENYNATFGPTSPATYLKNTLLSKGELVTNYFGTSHVSLGNYIAQVSGQGTTPSINNDCLDLNSLAHPPMVGGFTNITPGTDATDTVNNPGQVLGDGCVFPAPTGSAHGASTIGDQLDAQYPGSSLNWRAYAEDMGNDPARDYGTPDPMGGTTCAHPPIGGVDHSNGAAANDQYATRHNPFVYFHSVIDDQARCDSHVVPMGKVTVSDNGGRDHFSGHLYEDLKTAATTPKFMFVTPNLCNDAHDASCVGPNVENIKDNTGKNIGGLVSADLWLRHWMPMIFKSEAYRSGKMLVVLTFDESGFTDSRACEKANQADCQSPTGPNLTNPGFSPILGMFGYQSTPNALYTYAGGGQVGAILFNKHLIKAGSVNTTGSYNHYSALRSYEDILGLTSGGDDGHGHLGYAALPSEKPFGKDVFNGR